MTIRDVLETVSARYGYSVSDILSDIRLRGVVLARQVAMYLAGKWTDCPLAELAKGFERREATIVVGVKNLERRMAEDAALSETVCELSKILRDKESGAFGDAELDDARVRLLNVMKARAVSDSDSNGDVELQAQIFSNAKLVRGYLDKIKFHYFEETDEDEVVFRGTICAKGEIIDIYLWQISVDAYSIQSIFRLPTHVAEKRRKAMAEFLAYVNYPLKWGRLSEDIADDGEIVFELCIPASALKGDVDEEVDRLIGLPTCVLETYTPGIIDVIQGCDPREAFAKCEKHSDVSENDRAEKANEAEDADEVESQRSQGDDGNGKESDLTANYSLDGLNVSGDIPLDRVVSAVRKFKEAGVKSPDSPRMNILLCGPSGSGKSEFVKYLGRKVGSKVMTVTASTILSPMVGRTERNLAQIFREAGKSKSILFLDEIDSVLASRENADHSWEVTQVNELLIQMEKFQGVMVGATNFDKNLDKAVARRFTFKLKLDYLTDEGKAIFFRKYFQTALSVEDRNRLNGIAHLTPGDFRTVRQRLFYLSAVPTNQSRLAALEAESEAKGGARGKIGF